MRKLIASINMTLDGYCDHTAMIADKELHQHYSELIKNASMILYGRITYQLMENAWPAMVKNPTGDKAMDEFAITIDNASKIVFSRTLQQVDWKNTTLKNEMDRDEILQLKNQNEKDILVGSPSLIAVFTQLGLIDEYQICIHPVILGNGLSLFKDIASSVSLALINVKTFNSGGIILCYQPTNFSKG